MPTFTQIGSAVVVGSGGQASIDFTSIPSTYTDLVLVASLRENNTSDSSVVLSVNGSTANLSGRRLLGTGSGSPISTGVGATVGNADHTGYTASTFSNMTIYITNYASTTTFKSISADGVSENNATEAIATLNALLQSSNSAITSLSLSCIGTIVQYSTAYLYGVSNA
jgi:hypothetical protein